MQLVRSAIQLLAGGYMEIFRTTVRRYIKRFEQEKLPVKDFRTCDASVFPNPGRD